MFEELILLSLVVICLAFLILYRAYAELKKDYSEVIFRKQSLSTKYGKMTEQFMPLLALYPYDEQNFRFLGSPIDGVQFNDEGIVFVEFKSAGAGLSPQQKRIKRLVGEKKVTFEEIRLPTEDANAAQ
ncbi:MAG: Holliday junction resolvase-like protein [Candidatus Aenigmatarchaeota archaeon]